MLFSCSHEVFLRPWQLRVVLANNLFVRFETQKNKSNAFFLERMDPFGPFWVPFFWKLIMFWDRGNRNRPIPNSNNADTLISRLCFGTGKKNGWLSSFMSLSGWVLVWENKKKMFIESFHVKIWFVFWYRLVHVEKPKFIPPRRLFDSDREMLHTSSTCPGEDLTRCFCCCFFAWFFLRKMWTTLAQIFSAKKETKRKKNGGQTSGWACRTRAHNFRV